MPNLAETFAASRRENFYDVMLNLEHFAETVTFLPAGGGASRQLICSIEGVRRTEERTTADYDVEEIRVRVGKDQDHEKGGIAQPKPGDRLVRSADPGDEQSYGYNGQVLDEHDHSWRLLFTRPKIRRLGTEHIRK